MGCLALVLCVVAACVDPPPSTPDGHNPDADDCCWGLVFPWLDDPGSCLCDCTAPGDQSWLSCIGGEVTYWCDLRGVP